MNFSKQTSIMAALFLSLGAGIPAIAAGAKATGLSSGSTLTPTSSGTGVNAERSPENTQTQAEPTAHQDSPGALGGTPAAPSDPLTGAQGPGASSSSPLDRSSRGHRSTSRDRAQQGSSIGQLERDTVMDLQTALQAEGVYQGSIDGVPGAKTKRALRQYQKARQLDASGQLDAETMRQLGLSRGGEQVPVRGVDNARSPSGSLRGAVRDNTSPPPLETTLPGIPSAAGTLRSSAPSGAQNDFGTGVGTGIGVGANSEATTTTRAGNSGVRTNMPGAGVITTPGAVNSAPGGSRGAAGTTGAGVGATGAGVGTSHSGRNRATGTSGTTTDPSGRLNSGSGANVRSGAGAGAGSGSTSDNLVNPVGGQNSGSSAVPGGASAPVQP